MARQEVVEAVRDRLGAEWSHCPVIEMNRQGEAPEDGSAFLMVQYPVTTQRRLSVGTPYYREEGGIRFVLNMQRGEGVDTALQWAGELADLFRYVTFDEVHGREASSPNLDDSNDMGNYFVVTVVVEYYFDFVD